MENKSVPFSTHCCSKTRAGWFPILRLTIKKRVRVSLAAIRATLKRRRHESVVDVGRWLQRVVQGYFNYHAVPGNLRRLNGFRLELTRAWRQSLLRHSHYTPLTVAPLQTIGERIHT
ncbi:hypothetical protein [Pseudomonas paeninsulae]|uniref:hypothetical protein n=1 Tax=Pseudomonas paeninsulae TaxID=3110772 RepID=UPI002D792E80|nr:hypothetical protein [Pseudomonas sp. IT1137]